MDSESFSVIAALYVTILPHSVQSSSARETKSEKRDVRWPLPGTEMDGRAACSITGSERNPVRRADGYWKYARHCSSVRVPDLEEESYEHDDG